MTKKIVKLGLASIIASSALLAGTYNVDTAHSSVGFKVKHLMISNVKGSFDKFDGSFDYDEKTNTLNSLSGNIDVASVNTDNAKRDGHLKSADFFESTKYPNIKFDLIKASEDTAIGKLTIHGITKEVELDFENNGTITDPWGNKRVGLAISGKIDRRDFGLKYNSILEAGGVMIGEEVKLDIEIEGILQK